MLKHIKVKELRGQHLFRKGLALHTAKDFPAAAAAFQDWLHIEPDAATAWHWLAHLTTGQDSQTAYQHARRYYEEQKEQDDAFEDFYQLACICAMLGDHKAAYGYLKEAIDFDSDCLIEAHQDRELDSMRHLPAFAKLLNNSSN